MSRRICVVIEELINLAKDIKEANRKGADLGLNFREFAFYSALEVNDSAVAVKKILRKHGYPPDMETKATETVIEQAKLLTHEFSITKEYHVNTEDTIQIAAEPD